MRSLTGLMVLILLAACANDGKEDEAVVPQEGVWDEGEGRGDDACGLYADNSGNSSFTLQMDDDGEGFSVTLEEGEERICALDGGDFTCELPSDFEDGEKVYYDYSGSGQDAVVYLAAEVFGSFWTSTEGILEHELSMSCEGTDCEDAVEDILQYWVSLPCTSSMSWPVTAR